MTLLGCPPIASGDIHTFAIKGLNSAGGPQDWALAIWVRYLAIRPNAALEWQACAYRHGGNVKAACPLEGLVRSPERASLNNSNLISLGH